MLSSIRANVKSFNYFSGRRAASCNQSTISIILGCLLGVVAVFATVGFIIMLFFHARKRSIDINCRQSDIQWKRAFVTLVQPMPWERDWHYARGLRFPVQLDIGNEDSGNEIDIFRRFQANARNVSFRISLRWPIHIISPVDKTKLSSNTPTDAAPQFL